MIDSIRILLVAALLFVANVAEAASNAPAALKLYIFDCGLIYFPTIERFSISDDETDIRHLIIPCYMVEHEKGRLLFDGGLPTSLAELDGWKKGDFDMRLDRTLVDQLEELDLDLSDFDYVAFSHLHFDHAGVANDLTGATLIIQQPEYDIAFAEVVTARGFKPESYSGMKEAEKIIVDGDYDVFGDGRVRILATPGHTAGHQALFIDLENTGPIVLSGDLYHFDISRSDRRVPVFNDSEEQTLESMDRIEALVEETGATLWIQHELALFETLNKAPAFYD